MCWVRPRPGRGSDWLASPAPPQAARSITGDLAVSLGLGDGLGRNAPLSRTLTRMVAFGAAARSGDHLAVRLALPDVPAGQTGRLSRSARLAHQRWGHPPADPPATAHKSVAAGVGL